MPRRATLRLLSFLNMTRHAFGSWSILASLKTSLCKLFILLFDQLPSVLSLWLSKQRIRHRFHSIEVVFTWLRCLVIHVTPSNSSLIQGFHLLLWFWEINIRSLTIRARAHCLYLHLGLGIWEITLIVHPVIEFAISVIDIWRVRLLYLLWIAIKIIGSYWGCIVNCNMSLPIISIRVIVLELRIIIALINLSLTLIISITLPINLILLLLLLINLHSLFGFLDFLLPLFPSPFIEQVLSANIGYWGVLILK